MQCNSRPLILDYERWKERLYVFNEQNYNFSPSLFHIHLFIFFWVADLCKRIFKPSIYGEVINQYSNLFLTKTCIFHFLFFSSTLPLPPVAKNGMQIFQIFFIESSLPPPLHFHFRSFASTLRGTGNAGSGISFFFGHSDALFEWIYNLYIITK